MKIIEAMKRVKLNTSKINELRTRIGKASANTNHETPEYGAEQASKIQEWLQAIHDLGQDNINLLVSIQRTNLVTMVPIEIAGKTITRTIAEWVWRRREYSDVDLLAYQQLTDRGIKEGMASIPGQTEKLEVKIVRHFDPSKRDAKITEYRGEKFQIDSALEIINATVDLIPDRNLN